MVTFWTFEVKSVKFNIHNLNMICLALTFVPCFRVWFLISYFHIVFSPASYFSFFFPLSHSVLSSFFLTWDLRFSWRWRSRLRSSVFWRRVDSQILTFRKNINTDDVDISPKRLRLPTNPHGVTTQNNTSTSFFVIPPRYLFLSSCSCDTGRSLPLRLRIHEDSGSKPQMGLLSWIELLVLQRVRILWCGWWQREGKSSAVQIDSLDEVLLWSAYEVCMLISFSVCQLLPKGKIIYKGQIPSKKFLTSQAACIKHFQDDNSCVQHISSGLLIGIFACTHYTSSRIFCYFIPQE